MKIAIVSDDFQTVSGKAGRARRFLLFDAPKGQQPRLEKYFELPKDHPTYHDLHDDDSSHFPLDGIVLITNEAGEGFRERLARRGTRVCVTSERDPHAAVRLLLEDVLPDKAPIPHEESDCSH